MTVDHCPHCDAPLKPNAVACRECGSDIETGWSSDIDYHSIELPEDDPPPKDPAAMRTVAVICIIVLLAGSGVAWLLRIPNLAVVLVVIGLALPIALGKVRGGPDDSDLD